MGEGRCCPENQQLGLLDCSVLLSEITHRLPCLTLRKHSKTEPQGIKVEKAGSGHEFGDSKHEPTPSWKIRLDPTRCAWGVEMALKWLPFCKVTFSPFFFFF